MELIHGSQNDAFRNVAFLQLRRRSKRRDVEVSRLQRRPLPLLRRRSSASQAHQISRHRKGLTSIEKLFYSNELNISSSQHAVV